jgi:hypothetical protein
MNLKDFSAGALQVLKTLAPTVVDTLAGPFAPLVDPIIQGLFGTTDPKQVNAALLSATPDQILAIKQAESAHAEKLVQMGIDRDKLAFDDTANARAREIAVRDNTPKVLAYGVTIGFFLALLGLNLLPIPAENRATIYSMVGSLGTVWILIMGYYFGSSSGSASKTDTINKIAVAAAK